MTRLGASEKAALRLLVDFQGTSLEAETRRFFETNPFTGVILFQKNIESRLQVKRLISEFQTISSVHFSDCPMIISIDEEGGSVSPLKGLVTPSPGNMALAACGDEEAVYEMARRTGGELRELGFNVDFAPVLDVNINPENPIIGVRSFGENPEKVAEYGIRAIRGYEDEGVAAVAKHFPGHGDTARDSHLDLPVVNASLERIMKIEIYPFRQAVQAGASGIMTAHVIFPCLDKKPATLSKKILTGILREQLKFDGIIFTDSFAMAAIKEHFDLEEAVRDSILAGGDILLALGEKTFQLEIFQILKSLIEKKKIPDECVDEPLRRILGFRRRMASLPPQRRSNADAEEQTKKLHEKCVTVLKGKERLPLPGDATIFLSPDATSHLASFQKHFPRASFVPWPWPAGHLSGEIPRWIFMAERRLLAGEAEIRLKEWGSSFECAVSFGNPYLLKKIPSSVVQMTTYHVNEIFVEIVSRVLLEGKEAPGKPPVNLS